MKIAACDFDGTLFRDGVVSEADLEAIADWRRSGNAFGIVTGRGRNTLLRDVKRFSIPYDFLICNNGAMICDEQAQDVYCAVLPEPVRAEIMDHPGMRQAHSARSSRELPFSPMRARRTIGSLKSMCSPGFLPLRPCICPACIRSASPTPSPGNRRRGQKLLRKVAARMRACISAISVSTSPPRT